MKQMICKVILVLLVGTLHLLFLSLPQMVKADEDEEYGTTSIPPQAKKLGTLDCSSFGSVGIKAFSPVFISFDAQNNEIIDITSPITLEITAYNNTVTDIVPGVWIQVIDKFTNRPETQQTDSSGKTKFTWRPPSQDQQVFIIDIMAFNIVEGTCKKRFFFRVIR